MDGKGEGEQTWVRVVQGPSRAPTWTSHKITKEEIDQHQSFFSKVLELPELLLDDSRRQWEGLAVVFRSLGRRILAAWVSKEVRLRPKLEYDPEVFSIAEDHLVLQLSSEGDCARVKGGGPWFVGGQLMAMDT